jgi:hypothetical protein
MIPLFFVENFYEIINQSWICLTGNFFTILKRLNLLNKV